jgi:hypothetical protein
MSHILCVTNFTDETISFDATHLGPYGAAFQIGIEDRQVFTDLRLEVEIDGHIEYKPNGSYSYGRSDQEFVDYVYFDLLPDTAYSASVMVRDGSEVVTDVLNFTTPIPDQPYPSWTWVKPDWVPPVPYPSDIIEGVLMYDWDEEGQQWVAILAE